LRSSAGRGARPCAPAGGPKGVGLTRGELKDRRGVVALARSQDRGWETRLVGRVRIVLGFQAKSIALLVDVPLLSGDGAVQEIARVELHARFCRGNLQGAPAVWFDDPRRECQAFALPVNHEVVIVTAPENQLLILLTDPGSDGGGLGEIEGGPFHAGDLAGGDKVLIHRGEVVGV